MSLRFDENVASRVAGYRSSPEAAARRRALLDLLNIRPGDVALDVGCGAGFLAIDIAARLVRAVRCMASISASRWWQQPGDWRQRRQGICVFPFTWAT